MFIEVRILVFSMMLKITFSKCLLSETQWTTVHSFVPGKFQTGAVLSVLPQIAA